MGAAFAKFELIFYVAQKCFGVGVCCISTFCNTQILRRRSRAITIIFRMFCNCFLTHRLKHIHTNSSLATPSFILPSPSIKGPACRLQPSSESGYPIPDPPRQVKEHPLVGAIPHVAHAPHGSPIMWSTCVPRKAQGIPPHPPVR